MKKLVVVSAIIALLSGIAAQAAVTVQENTIFPDSDVFASQLVDESTAGIRDIANPIEAHMGQSFTLTNSTTLRAITVKSHSTTTWNTGDDVLELWIGADSDPNPTNFVAGATSLLTTVDVGGLSVTAGNYYTVNLDSDLVLPAGDYAYQFRWTSTAGPHQWFLRRANTGGDYEGGGLLFVQKTDGSAINFPFDVTAGFANDMVFGLHTATVGTVPTFAVNPEEIAMQLIPPANQVTGTADVAFTADSTMDVSISISDESHPGSFSVLSITPQTLTTNSTLEFEFDNSVAGLASSETATGLVTIAWNETGKTTTNELVLPISTIYASPGTYTRTGTDTIWSTLAGWRDNSSGTYSASTRLPIEIDTVVLNSAAISSEQLVADIDASVLSLSIVNTANSAALAMTNDVTLSVLNNMTVGDAGQDGTGTVDQSAGTISVGSRLTISSNTTSGVSSTYNLTGGEVSAKLLDIQGTLNVDGGTFTIDNAANHQTSGIGTIKVQSGTFQATATGATTVDNYECAIKISGGTVNIGHQSYFSGGLTIIGDAADVNIGFINSPSILNFQLGANGVSTIDGPSATWATLGSATINIDGSAYTGGSQNIVLLKSPNLTTASTSATVNVTGFSVGYGTAVTIDEGNDNQIILAITAAGYLGWSSEFDVGSKTNNEDGDVLNNLYEYGLGGNPTNAADIGMDSSMVSGAGYIDYVHVRRVEATNEISYALALTDNLIFGTWTTNTGYTVVGYGPVVGEFDTVTNRIDTTGETAEFIKLIIEEL